MFWDAGLARGFPWLGRGARLVVGGTRTAFRKGNVLLGERDDQLTFGDLAYEYFPRNHPVRPINQVADFSFVPELVTETYGTTEARYNP